MKPKSGFMPWQSKTDHALPLTILNSYSLLRPLTTNLLIGERTFSFLLAPLITNGCLGCFCSEGATGFNPGHPDLGRQFVETEDT
jgi:hypothetical protein